MTETLAHRIREARTAAGLSQSAVARALKIRSQSVNQWESGTNEPSRDNLVAFAQLTGCGLPWLFYGSGLPEQAANGRLYSVQVRGRLVPELPMEAAVRGERPTVNARGINSVFPCGDNAFYFIVQNDSCAPEHPAGTVWVVDPDLAPTPGAMVLAAYGDERRPVIGEVVYETTAAGECMIVRPTNARWPQARSNLGRLEIVAVMTESIRRGSSA